MSEKNTPRTWIITGATAGLGQALAEAALEAGENVVGTARRPERFGRLRERFGERLVPVEHDVRDTGAAAAVVGRAVDRFGGVDVLVNNAGVGQVGAAEEVTDGELHDMLAQHLLGPAALVRAVLPLMRRARAGAIVQMSSQGGACRFPPSAAIPRASSRLRAGLKH
jgi:NADP-dependent 3-hydroxy acid dehydrogenase YdfG